MTWNVEDALTDIAQQFNLDADALKRYAAEAPDIGGFAPGQQNGKWTVGCIWEVDGVMLYALVRAMKPRHCLEVGTFYGCSSRYIIAALRDNGFGHLTTMDNGDAGGPGPQFTDEELEIVNEIRMDLFDYQMPSNKYDFVFEDAMHSSAQVHHIWGMFKEVAPDNAMIISHDAEQFLVGQAVRAGISAVTDQYKTYLVPPGDCGMAIWRKTDRG